MLSALVPAFFIALALAAIGAEVRGLLRRGRP